MQELTFLSQKDIDHLVQTVYQAGGKGFDSLSNHAKQGH